MHAILNDVLSVQLFFFPSNQIIFCRPISDVSSDLTVEIGASSFALHKVRKIYSVLVTLLSKEVLYRFMFTVAK